MRISDWSSDVCSSDLADRVLVQRRHDLALGGDALANLGPEGSGSQEGRLFGHQQDLVDGRAHLPADLENVLETGGHEDARLGPLAFQDGIGRNGRTMDEALDIDRKSTRLNSSH